MEKIERVEILVDANRLFRQATFKTSDNLDRRKGKVAQVLIQTIADPEPFVSIGILILVPRGPLSESCELSLKGVPVELINVQTGKVHVGLLDEWGHVAFQKVEEGEYAPKIP